jgi:hypothetical protein
MAQRERNSSHADLHATRALQGAFVPTSQVSPTAFPMNVHWLGADLDTKNSYSPCNQPFISLSAG